MAHNNEILSFKNICKNHQGNKVLDNVSFDINTNQITTLVGPNGAGKTTIAKIILGITKADRGKVIKTMIPECRICLRSFTLIHSTS